MIDKRRHQRLVRHQYQVSWLTGTRAGTLHIGIDSRDAGIRLQRLSRYKLLKTKLIGYKTGGAAGSHPGAMHNVISHGKIALLA
jgi:hypothetical protein